MKHFLLLIITAMFTVSTHAQTFGGYECTQDCSGHRAGYEWASRKHITDASQCRGNSQSFIDGCLAYVEGQ